MSFTPEAVRHAMERLQAFVDVQQERSKDERMRAMALLFEAAGLDRDTRLAVEEALERLMPEWTIGHGMVATLLAFFMQEHVQLATA